MPGDAELALRVLVRGDASRPRLDVELDFPCGVTCVTGPSGAGKSTLLASIAGLLRPDAGRIVLGRTVLFDDRRSVFVPPHRRRVALVFQSLALFPHMSGWQNVAYGLPDTTPRSRRRAAAMTWLERADAAHVAARRPESFSGGEAQRVALARALASEPDALLLDEPFSAMDAALRHRLAEALRRLIAEVRIPTILVTHNRADATRLDADIIELADGRLAERG
jgi:molybdate transport system ATP-binding protein